MSEFDWKQIKRSATAATVLTGFLLCLAARPLSDAVQKAMINANGASTTQPSSLSTPTVDLIPNINLPDIKGEINSAIQNFTQSYLNMIGGDITVFPHFDTDSVFNEEEGCVEKDLSLLYSVGIKGGGSIFIPANELPTTVFIDGRSSDEAARVRITYGEEEILPEIDEEDLSLYFIIPEEARQSGGIEIRFSPRSSRLTQNLNGDIINAYFSVPMDTVLGHSTNTSLTIPDPLFCGTN